MHVDSSAKPLVPYPVGISGQGLARQPARSRLANSNVADFFHGKSWAMPPAALPSHVMLWCVLLVCSMLSAVLV